MPGEIEDLRRLANGRGVGEGPMRGSRCLEAGGRGGEDLEGKTWGTRLGRGRIWSRASRASSAKELGKADVLEAAAGP